jgi:hypothetical protein
VIPTFSKFFSKLEQPVSAAPFVSFRIVFGLLMAISTIRFVYFGWIEDHYLEPIVHFYYYGFSWLPIFSAPVIYGIHMLMLLAAIGVMLGRFYRISAILLFLCFSYTELIDLTYYLNHYYFVSLVCLWLIFIPEPNQQFQLPRWCIFIFKFQITLVYLFAGLAKINHDWLLEALPLKIWLPAHDDLPLIGGFMKLPETAYLFSWFGMLYDCSIAFFLLYKPTRLLAYFTVIIFHALTGMLFQIGVFPIVMIASALIFFSEGWHLKFQSYLRKLGLFRWNHTKNEDVKPLLHGRILMFVLSSYCLFQLAFPWRYVLYPGNLFWTEEGYRFSWRVMLMEKAGTATFFVKDANSGREGIVDNREFLNAHQEKQMAMQPDLILQFAKFLARHFESEGMVNPSVRAEVYVTLNAKPSQLLIDPSIDLSKLDDTWAPKSWINPHQP